MGKNNKKRKRVKPELYDHSAHRGKQVIARVIEVNLKTRRIKELSVRSYTVFTIDSHDAVEHKGVLHDEITSDQDSSSINGPGVENREEMEAGRAGQTSK